ncbi:hypothetical protein L9F63_018882, partial [Diploptera punctata]
CLVFFITSRQDENHMVLFSCQVSQVNWRNPYIKLKIATQQSVNVRNNGTKIRFSVQREFRR